MDVTAVASQWIWGSDGKIKIIEKNIYVNADGVKMVGLKIRHGDTNNRLKRYEGFYSAIESEKPDILFIHSCQFLDMNVIAKYLKCHQGIIAYVDNHCDFTNSASSWLSRNVLHKIIWKSCVRRIEPFIKKFYGMLPARVDFLKSMYDVPDEKCKLLVMGADDEFVHKASDKDEIRKTRFKYGIDENKFLIVTGGKIDLAKTQTLYLMEAVKRISKDIELIVFGSVADELKEKFDNLCKPENIHYIGWISAEESYLIIAAADLAAFPGRHSVYWEQAAALGKPMILKHWDGTTHIDVGGNVKYLYKDSPDEIEEVIRKIFSWDNYQKMEEIAVKNSKRFLYSEIAKISIDEC